MSFLVSSSHETFFSSKKIAVFFWGGGNRRISRETEWTNAKNDVGYDSGRDSTFRLKMISE